MNSIKKRIDSGELRVTQTDKSSRFAVLTNEQYLAAGFEHTKKDQEINWQTVKSLQRQVNNHMWWLIRIVNYGKNKEMDRMQRNTQNNTLEVPEMVLLVKDHKKWSEDNGTPVPSRPVVSGSKGINTHMSELVSEILEPIVKEMNAGEVCSTEETLSKFDQINSMLDNGNRLEDFNMLPTLAGMPENKMDRCTDLEITHNSDTDLIDTLVELAMNNNQNLDENKDDYGSELSGANLNLNRTRPDISNVVAGDASNYSMNNPISASTPIKNKSLITEYFQAGIGHSDKDLVKENRKWLTRLIETETRQAEDAKTLNETTQGLCKAGVKWEKLNRKDLETKGNKSLELQDFTDNPIMLGSDVAALYPSMGKVQSAQLAKQAVEESGIKFSGIDYKILAIYLYVILGSSILISEGLGRIIPTRKDGKTNSKSLASKTNRSIHNWNINENVITDSIEKKMIGLLIKVLTIVLMETTVYSFGGRLFKQKEGAGIGLRSSACLAKIVMGMVDKKWANIQTLWNLKVQLYIRYIDDLRIYLWPIKDGWSWNGSEWEFSVDNIGNKSAMARTSEEICKTLNSTMDFLTFTMETEEDFSDTWLPTLDVKTKINSSGKISYKFYKKPMANNLTIQYGSALSSNTIFSSLRQEITRRMLNTSLDIDLKERLYIIEEYIGDLRTSGHRYPYIKALTLQGITRYLYMLKRSNLQVSDPKYMPIHRPTEYRRVERLLSKYIEQMTWFQNNNLNDPFKTRWRQWITRKRDRRRKKLGKRGKLMNHRGGVHRIYTCGGVKHNKRVSEVATSNKSTSDTADAQSTVDESTRSTDMPIAQEVLDKARVLDKASTANTERNLPGKYESVKNIKLISGQKLDIESDCMNDDSPGQYKDRPITTVMFVPSSNGSGLLKKVSEAEENLQDRVSWRSKVIEQPGVPLLMSFVRRSPILSGCPDGQKCTICENDAKKCSTKSVVYSATCSHCSSRPELKLNPKLYTYIGETSRPWRSRVSEHLNNATMWRQKSFILEHWMTHHGTETVRPTFNFKVLECYGDALRRQLAEGLYIIDRGGLNRRNEFCQNNLCRLQIKLTDDQQEETAKQIAQEKRDLNEKLENFIDVMRNVYKRNIHNSPDSKPDTFRIKTEKKRRAMDVMMELDQPTIPSKKSKPTTTSTPDLTRWREGNQTGPNMEESPIESFKGKQDDSTGTSGSQNADSSPGSKHGILQRTNASNELSMSCITPPKKLTTSQEDRGLENLTRNWSSAAARSGLLKKVSSAPDGLDITGLKENSMYKDFSSRRSNGRRFSVSSCDEFDLSTWDEEEILKSLRLEKARRLQREFKRAFRRNSAHNGSNKGSSHKSTIKIGTTAPVSLLKEPAATPKTSKSTKRQLKWSPSTPNAPFRRLKMENPGSEDPLRKLTGEKKRVKKFKSPQKQSLRKKIEKTLKEKGTGAINKLLRNS